MLLRSEIRRVQEVVRRYFSDKNTTDTRLDAVEGTAVTLQESINELQSSDGVDLTDYYTKAEVDLALESVGGEFAGTMDDIPDGTAYVKTHNDFTDADQSKLGGIEAGAEVNVQADWNQATNAADDYIKNKPTILALGETSTTAYRGDRGKTAYDHSQVTHAPSDADNTISAIASAGTGADITSPTIAFLSFNSDTQQIELFTLKSLTDYLDTRYTPL